MCKPFIDSSPLKVNLKTKKLVSQFAVSLISTFLKIVRYNGEKKMHHILKLCHHIILYIYI